jgi:Zn-dependent protease
VGRSIPLGRFAGIKVSMDLTVPLVAALFAFSLAKNLLPAQVPYQSSGSYWLVGVIGAVLFFVSLLAHEVGHALMARRENIGVEGISLWLLGGLAKFEHEAENPGAELRIAGIGPVTSAGVGVVFLFISQSLGGDIGLLGLFAHLCSWLGFINLVLAAFNLLPGVPLDGGRVLGALLWMRTRDQTGSQALADRVGQVLGGALLMLGGVLCEQHSYQNGVWVLVVGLFIFVSASAELKSTAALGLLRGVRLGEVMDADPPALPEWMSVHDLVTHAAAYMPHTAFVTRGLDGRVTGLLTAEAVQATDPRLWASLRLSQLAFPVDRVQVGHVDDSVLVTMQRAQSNKLERVLVLWPDGRVAGVTPSDLSRRAAAAHQARTQPPSPNPPGDWAGVGASSSAGSGPPSSWPGPTG